MESYIFNILVFSLQVLNGSRIERLGYSLQNLYRRAYWESRLKRKGSKAVILKNVVIKHPQMVAVGDNSVIGEFVHIWGGGGVSIGNHVLVASHCAITSMTHDADSDLFSSSLIKKSVKIGNNVWIGSGSTILPGVSIGDGCIVGAGSVVTADVPENWIVVGVPAKKVRLRRSVEV